MLEVMALVLVAAALWYMSAADAREPRQYQSYQPVLAG